MSSLLNKIKAPFIDTLPYRIYKKSYARFFSFVKGNPSKNMTILGVTGTDGKSTTSAVLHYIINQNLGKCALISTVSIKFGDKEIINESKMTSLDPMHLQNVLLAAKNEGCKYVVLEVSSHALNQYRFEGVDFDLGVLTNFSEEHLDYHKTFEEYVKSKKKLFDNIISNEKEYKYAVLPGDDKIGRQRDEDFSFDRSTIFSINASAPLKAEQIHEYVYGTHFQLKYLGEIHSVKVQLLGSFNVYNILAAIGAAMLLGVSIEKSIKSASDFKPLSGRQQTIHKDGRTFVIDFAHTPKGLESVLSFLNNVKNGRIITVFGAPGNRDKFKRPLMGEVVGKKSDIAIITDDDPDTENRYSILSQIYKGIEDHKTFGEDVFVVPDREDAIKLAKDLSQEQDIVFLAGKGHETVQVTNFGKRERSDEKQVYK
ncbi:UDP-N-acetylmuramoyl-L-alanyl-D-glutamate--2,6-diaminopimelate ligase [Candidatus Absconditicoccus praedator]|uniref:UDP-N-acetylmuramoyl-L-alanyl-D-glutamate--2, 6-diaminopimelate ligase n=1 Tax=Candidatus Absconditicoccus praedator TaxID=2735562 RepID=UPI001E517A4B|nr:UDP-N-acetylmuramoyl-L-alanyl-D-glutamate--2,6-diaminopimelate ligase [Candidatus Absconditicoccus praedator]UFX82823.1 UDP-N-acetylmuramoyl-L-alanyl-D-glutamate--2,6-diaminopimelate ligase [Candidatus Absconditicoccus praedator]